MNQLMNLIPEGLVNALGWTLLHALWQGAFVALLLSVLLVLLHRQAARIRYAVASSAMLAQLLLSTATFTHYYSQTQESVVGLQPAVAAQAATVSTAAALSFWANPLAVSQVYFEQHLPLLVTLWLLGMALMAIRFIGGLAYTQRLRHYKAAPLGAPWQQQLDVLRRRLGINQAVQLVESALVQVPMAIGVAKPVILLPIGAVTGLTQAQLEAILAHELAHILRKDYLLNLLQSVVDMVFFFHPAMWWVSGVVRAERENCCDDMAVALCGDTLTYARALTELEAMRMPNAPRMALAFSGQRGSLMSRIRRLVGQPLKPTFTEGFAAGLVLVTGMLILSFGAMAERQPLKVVKPDQQKSEAKAAERKDEPEEAVTFVAQDAAGNNRSVVIITNKKGKVKQLYVDGKRIPKRSIDEYKDLIDQRLQMTQDAPKASRQEVQVLLEREREAVAKTRRGIRDERVALDRISGGIAPLPPLPPLPAMAPAPPPAPAPPAPPAPPADADNKEQEAYKRKLEKYEQELKQYEQQVKQYEQDVMRYQARVERGEHRRVEIMREHRGNAAEMRAHAEARQHEMEERRHEMEERHHEMEERRLEHAKHLEEMKAEMVKDGLIDKENDKLSIQIKNDEFYINGKKQPQQVYEKYKKWMNPGKE